MKKAIIIGHNAKDKGAYSPILKLHEFDFFSSMEKDLADLGTVYYHNPLISSYTGRMLNTAQRINRYDYDIVLAMHFNMFDGTAHGCEALYFHTNHFGKHISDRFCSAMHENTGIRNRGAKPLRYPNQRGYYEVAFPTSTTLILEPFFGDNQDDCNRFNADTFLHIIQHL